jgi:hypothetical protein
MKVCFLFLLFGKLGRKTARSFEVGFQGIDGVPAEALPHGITNRLASQKSGDRDGSVVSATSHKALQKAKTSHEVGLPQNNQVLNNARCYTP